MKKRPKKEHKFKFDPVNNADSIWSRSSSQRKMKSSADLKKSLGIEDEQPGDNDISAKQPLKMMDIVMQTWGELDYGETTDDEEDSENDTELDDALEGDDD